MSAVTVRFYASAHHAAGVPDATIDADTVADALAQVSSANEELARILAVSTIMYQGIRMSDENMHQPLLEDAVIEVLPPFAGG